MFSTFLSIVIWLSTALTVAGEPPTDVSVTLTFVNHTPISIEVYEVGEGESESPIQIVKSGEKANIPARPTSLWRVKSYDNKAFILETTAQNYNEKVDVKLISQKMNRGLGMYVTNNTPDTLEYFWIDYKGREKSYGIIKPNRTTTIVTYQTHPWLFKKLRSEELVHCIIADSSFEQRYTINEVAALNIPKVSEEPIFSAMKREKYMDISYLGVAFDAVHVDPKNLGANTVNDAPMRPRVLEFVPSDNQIALKGKQRYLPKGVEGHVSNLFRWHDDVAWVKSADEFRNGNMHFFERTTELIQETAMTQSASYKEIDGAIGDGKNLYIEQIGNYVSFVMTVFPSDQTYPLASGFRKAVGELSDNAIDYDQFVEYWGTHFSSEVVVGGRCSYQFELLTSGFESQDENIDLYDQFRQILWKVIPRIKVNFNAPQNEQRVRDVSDALGANKVKFIPYNSEALYYDKWAKDALNNPALIDVQLTSYLNLLNSRYFPDDEMIATKKKLMKEAMDRYYKQFVKQ